CAPHPIDRVIVQLSKLRRCAAPVADVGLIPDFPVPGLDFSAAILLDAMFGPLEDQLCPLRIVLRRISPACIDLLVTRARRPTMLIRLRLDRQIFWHEANLRIGTHAPSEISIEDTVEDRPVVEGSAVRVIAISAC